jgi:hypothetical protein
VGKIIELDEDKLNDADRTSGRVIEPATLLVSVFVLKLFALVVVVVVTVAGEDVNERRCNGEIKAASVPPLPNTDR